MRSFCPVFERRSLSLSYHCPDRRRRGRPKIDHHDQPPILFVRFYDAPEWIPFAVRGPANLSLPLPLPFLFFFNPSFYPPDEVINVDARWSLLHACFVSFLAERCVDHRALSWSCRGRVQISGDIQFTRDCSRVWEILKLSKIYKYFRHSLPIYAELIFFFSNKEVLL